MNNPDTDCRKCGAPMNLVATSNFTITGYRCEKCDHWNNLDRRKPRKKK